MYLQNVQEENVNPEQIIETAEKVLLLLNNHRDLILQEEMPVYQIPIYQMLQVANIRLNHDENALYYARKGVELCDGINADNNAQLNGMIRDSKRMFQEYINQNAQKVPEKAKRKDFFKLLDEIIDHRVERVVITYKDRLSRVGFDLSIIFP